MDMEVQEPKYSLQFQNYKDTLCGNLIRYFNTRCFVNVTLICNGEAITAHQVVLSACSQFFENILIARTEPHPVLVFADIPKNHMELLLEFMYKGQISVSKSLLPSLLTTAKKLRIRGLNYERFNNPQINSGGEVYVTNTTQNSSPVLIETSRQNVTVRNVQNIEGQGLDNEESPKWLSSSTPKKREECGKKVINPFAVKSRSINDSDSTVYDYDPCAPGPSKNNFNKHPPFAVFSPDKNDSDVEIVDNAPSIVVIADTQTSDNSYDKQKRVQKRGRTVKASSQINEDEFTSDDSEIISNSPKKVKNNVIVDHSDDTSDVPLSVIVTQNSATSQNTNRGEDAKSDKSGSPNRSGNGESNLSVAIENDHSNESDKSETGQILNRDNGAVWSLEPVEEPFEGYNKTPFYKLRNFCIICQKYMCANLKHVRKHHGGGQIRRKTFTCKTCSKKFYREKVLEIHKCEVKKKNC
ncbi:protein tramtrack, beta isoform-like [Anoplophora glabripennis]|uniref:protein tramtrack, beta isoform-like n=1 Tax=Anoplophora glabripennis TaxID=217634 RepID=UPI00087526CD|nr:protein tramtrack, beta isoform-like [Anoplophora glabripennis]